MIPKNQLRNLGAVNFDDPKAITKIREYAMFLQKHVTGEELITVNALLARMDSLPLLQQSVQQTEAVVQQQIAHHAALEGKTVEF